jgi:plastocyanin
MRLLQFLLLALFTPQPLFAGTISGFVRAQGKEGADGDAAGGSYASKKLKFAERINYDEIRPFVVYIEGKVPGATLAHPLETVHQKDATFLPHVLPVMVGTTVEWPNDDPIFHNVYSKSDAASFDLGLYKKGDPPHRYTFVKPGEVDVLCSIHARMSCIVLVLENPYFSLTDAHGHYSITNVPPGKYTLVAWQERLPKDIKSIEVLPSGDVSGINFTVGPKNLPTY